MPIKFMKKPFECLNEVKERLSSLPNHEYQARWLTKAVLNLSDNDIILNSKEVDEKAFEKLLKAANRLAEGYPLQYLIGSTEFMGLPFIVRENVLIPRNDTEPMTELAVKHVGDLPLSVLDLCCGSGCIGLSIKHFCKNANVTLGDISKDALALSKDNADALGLDVNIVKTDMFEGIKGEFDLIISNPPYIPKEAISSLDRQVQFEPKIALDGGDDGLMFYGIIAQNYKKHLNKGGMLLLEIGSDQGEAVTKLFCCGEILQDMQGRDRIFKIKNEE